MAIRDWQAGETVDGFALVAHKEMRQDRNGRNYLDMVLADATGSMVAKVWSDSAALDGDYEAHDFVAFEGLVKQYRDQLQISLTRCRRASERDRAHGFDESELVPTTPYDVDQLWTELERLVSTRIETPALRRLATETLEAHGAALREHPAAKTIHHAYRGGLLEHVVSMAQLAGALVDHYRELDGELLLLGVLFHDLGKLEELGAMPRNDYTRAGRLVGHIVMGRDLLRERCAAIPDFPRELRLQLEHLVLSHHGERAFGSPVEPMSSEAIALAFLDNLDAKLAQLREARGSDGSEFRFLRGFGRMVFLGDDTEEEEKPAGAPSQQSLL